MMKVYDKINLTMLCDFYELTMAYGYFEKGYKERKPAILRKVNPKVSGGMGLLT